MSKSKISLTDQDIAVLSSVNAGLAFDAIDVNEVKEVKNSKNVKANVSSQNPDTGIANYNSKNTASYEQKNLPDGFHKKGMETK
jgi:hypothetical protein